MEDYLRALRQPANAGLTFECIEDEKRHHYQIVALGWEGDHRVYNLLFHLDIIGDKIWIQEDRMEYSVAEMLVEKGIPKSDIVLAFFPEYHRRHTEYAVA